MATNWPGSIDSPTDPTSGENLNSPSHSGLHQFANDAIVAIETYLGSTGQNVAAASALTAEIARAEAAEALAAAKANNLSDLANAGSSRFNLQVGIESMVAACSTTNISISAPGAAVDGYAFLTNDEVLLAGQSTASQNGIWTWNGASSPLTRPNEFPSGGVVKRGRVVGVANGTANGNSLWFLNAPAAGITIDTTAQVWGAMTIVNTLANEQVIESIPLSAMGAPTGLVNFNTQRAAAVAPGIFSTDSANVGQLVGNGLPYVVSGCVWTADSSGSSLNCSMTSGTVMIGNILLTVAAVTSRAFTANDDTYVDFTDHGDGTASISYTAKPNYTLSPAMAGGSVNNTIRCAVISAGASSVATAGIGQGAMVSLTNPGSQPSTTVAAGSSGANITAGTLDVASSASFPSGGGWAQVAHSGGQTYLIQFTGTGTGTLTGVTVIQGSGTVSTSDTVTGIWLAAASDMLGNRIYPATDKPGLVGANQYISAYTTTLTAKSPVPGLSSGGKSGFVAPFFVPGTAPRVIRITIQVPTFGCSSTAGSLIEMYAYLDNGVQNLGLAIPAVKVASDGDALNLTAFGLATPGFHTAQAWTQQISGSGTISVGQALAASFIFVELV